MKIKSLPAKGITRGMLRFFIFSFLTVFCCSEAAQALDKVKVIVLPFDIHASESAEYLQTEIQQAIKQHLKTEGALLISADSPDPLKGIKGYRKLGVTIGADYVIWGSLTRIGNRFSLDARMIHSFGETPAASFYVEGREIEHLSATVKELSREFGMKLFKRERVARVEIEGNQRIEDDAVKKIIRTAPGDVYLAKSLSEDLKAVFNMGYFDDIRINAEDGPDGKVVVFHVKEKPTVRYIRFKNNRIYEDEDLREKALTIKTGSILNVFVVQNNVRRIKSLYKEKNYHNVNVTYEIQSLENNQADLQFIIDEGEKVRISQINFIGNRAYSDDDLKDLMKTSEKGFWSWLTSSGDLNRDNLNQDISEIAAYYHNNGYIQARIGEPQVDYKDDWIYITVKIDEGPRFKVGLVKLDGEIINSDALNRAIKIDKQIYYSRDVVRNDILVLSDIYSDEGYAYSQITPTIDKEFNKDPKQPGRVNITYMISKGKVVHFEKIIITGNTSTRDKVIRRQLKVYEQEKYSGLALKRGIQNIMRLGYFEDNIKVNTLKGSTDDQMILKIDVQEKNTGAFSFGGGYSSVDKLFAMASVSERNLFGLGQILQLKAEVGGTASRFTLSFTEPWLFDIPLSAGFDVYNWERDYDTYDKDSKGAGIRFGYPVPFIDYTRFYVGYSYDVGEIENITADASDLVRDLEGTNITSSVSTSLHYDTKNKPFNPSKGMDNRLTYEYAGIGGDIGFNKYSAESGLYFPVFWGTVGFLHGKSGYVTENAGKKLPDYERYYLGGMNSLRGFDWRDIHEEDDDGAEIGGDKFVQFNIEYLIPLIKEAGVVGVLFYDTGNVFNNGEKMDFNELRESAGFGFRWFSPMGPIRIENGYILDPEEGESSSGRWEFTMGTAF